MKLNYILATYFILVYRNIESTLSLLKKASLVDISFILESIRAYILKQRYSFLSMQ